MYSFLDCLWITWKAKPSIQTGTWTDHSGYPSPLRQMFKFFGRLSMSPTSFLHGSTRAVKCNRRRVISGWFWRWTHRAPVRRRLEVKSNVGQDFMVFPWTCGAFLLVKSISFLGWPRNPSMWCEYGYHQKWQNSQQAATREIYWFYQRICLSLLEKVSDVLPFQPSKRADNWAIPWKSRVGAATMHIK